jgi:PfaB family protein
LNPSPHIAIVGIGGIFPGAMDVAQFWAHVLAGRSQSRQVPPGRWPLSIDDVYAPQLAPDKVYSKRGCFVDDFTCDLSGLNISREQLDRLDPMFHLLLHAGKAAWQDTVTKNIDPQRAGIIIGNIALPTDASSAITDEILGPLFAEKVLGRPKSKSQHVTDPLNRYVAGLPAGILAKALGIRGNFFTLDAACASSLYALKLAAEELRAGRADLMLTGGLSRPDCLYTQMGFSQLHALSPSGNCAPFDANADGLVVGEGAGIIALKRLDDALRDGDHIYATIAGIGLSNDIAGNLMQPDSSGQLRAMHAAYKEAGWFPEEIDLIECHGTGTPIGDAVEFNSLTQLWSAVATKRQSCVIGSVKSNVGHLLTAAGSAGLIKVLMALRYKKLPPTANFTAAAEKIDLADSPFTVLREAQEWPRPTAHPRRAAISGFGFGGINAHVLIEEWEPGATTTLSGRAIPSQEHGHELRGRGTHEEIAIIGMGASFGPWQSLTALKSRIFGNDTTQPAEPRRWWGAAERHQFKGFFIDEANIPLGRFRIPPAELGEMLPQQLLMLQVAADAFDDAHLKEPRLVNPTEPSGSAAGSAGFPERLDTGVFIGIGLDLNTTNFHFRWMLQEKARRWAKELGLKPTPAEMDQWIEQLRTAAGPALNANRTMGALGGIVASRVARAFHVGGPSFTISSEEASSLSALEVGIRALQRNEINIALVGAVDLAGDLRAVLGQNANHPYAGTPIGEGAAAVILKRHEDAIRDGDRIYAVVNGISSGADAAATSPGAMLIPRISREKHVEHRTTQTPQDHAQTHASAEAPTPAEAWHHTIECDDVGDAGAASGMASLVKAALCLHHESLAQGSTPRYWLRDRAAGPRRAGVQSKSIAGNSLHVTLEASASQTCDSAVEPAEAIFAVTAADAPELLAKLQQLKQLAAGSTGTLSTLAHQWFKQHAASTQACAVAMVAESLPRLADLITQARQAIEQNQPVINDRLFYMPTPVARTGKIAFVFPGSGTHFAGMGRDLAAQFPQILHRQDAENNHLASQFAAAALWSTDATEQLSPRDAIFAHVSLGTFVSDLLRAFAIKPHAVIGYSLGETTGFFATRTWTQRDEMFERMHASSLFTTELAGPCNAARRAWKLPAGQDVDWVVGVVDRASDIVRPALDKHHHAYLLIVNSPNECVVGGNRTAVENFVRDLGCHFHAVSGVTTVHCHVAKQVAAAYRNLHLLDTKPPKDIRFYSGALGKSYAVTRQSAADSIVGQAVAPFDFTKVIRSAYADGIRTFIEIGPGNSCTRMINQILSGRPQFTRAACIAGQNNVGTILRLLANLIAEGIAVDLGFLYAKEPPHGAALSSARSISVRPGGDPFNVPPPPRSHKPAKVRTEVKGLRTELEASQLSPQSSVLSTLIEQMTATQLAHAQTQETFLRFSQNNTRAMSEALSFQMSLLSTAGTALLEPPPQSSVLSPQHSPPALSRTMCLEFAIGSLAKVLGPAFARVDSYPTRVRLPDEPLMLVDRIVSIEGTPNSMTSGRVITEHDIHPNAWYLDANRIPTCIAVEAGQADLFLSGYLGIDSITKGHAVYRLLDAIVTFHGPLPTPGNTIVYDIAIENFFRQGDTHLFRFHFEATVSGQPFLTMTKGCAGFFTEAELAAGQGIVLTAIDKRPIPGKRPSDWTDLVPMSVESYSDDQLAALRTGNLAACFGSKFENLPIANPSTLPSGRMTLVHRILKLDPTAGRFALGQITGEADIHPDDWFLTCHFVDDRVMPGTLMYECCLHTLRVYLLRMGWVGEAGQVAYEPIPGIASQLKCRGQVTASTKKVQYEVTLKEIGYAADGTPYVIADALMSGDGKPIVQMTNMSVRLTGLTRASVEQLWSLNRTGPDGERTEVKGLRTELEEKSLSPQSSALSPPRSVLSTQHSALFDTSRITAFALGKPSDAFGAPYKIFDPGQPRKIARLPGPPYQFLDRITKIEKGEPFKLAPGGIIEAEYDIPQDAWYFAANSQSSALSPQSSEMPFSVLLEIALQPCGWLAAYLGSALVSDTDLKFRNLGGSATQFRPVLPDTGTLTTAIKITNVSHSGGMIIQHFDMAVRSKDGEVYKGNTYFGFFSKYALANQVGIREAILHAPTPAELARGKSFPYPTIAPFPADQMRMVDRIDLFDPAGGPKNLGFIRGSTTVNPAAWFFKAHFFEDPVWPGSLGLESFIQLLKVVAHHRWAADIPADQIQFQTLARHEKHSWIYRGQILPTDSTVTIEAVITHIDDTHHLLRADGFLSVDNRIIYQMKDFAIMMDTAAR